MKDFKNPGLLYGYIPTLWICILFVVLFGFSTILHLGQAIYFHIWWLLPTIVLGCLGETIGWAGRLWSTQTPDASALNPYLMQISTTIIAPTPMLAANFLMLGVMIKYLGTQYSRLSPKLYSIIFVSADIVALIVQAVGGASASQALQSGKGDPEKGGHVMLAGIIVQLVAIIIYTTLSSEFVFRYVKDRPVRSEENPQRGPLDTRLKLMLCALLLSTFFIFVRAIYRTIELSNGWTGDVIRTEVWFNIFDGGMITLSVYTIAILHPGLLLNHIGVGKQRGKSMRKDAEDNGTVVGTPRYEAAGGSLDLKEIQHKPLTT